MDLPIASVNLADKMARRWEFISIIICFSTQIGSGLLETPVERVDEIQLAKINLKISTLEQHLLDGADDYVQLLDLAFYVQLVLSESTQWIPQ